MTYDMRGAAWRGAQLRLENAEKLTLNADGEMDPQRPLPDLYWGLIASAAVHAQLASASLEIGLAVGDYCERVEKEQREANKMMRELMGEAGSDNIKSQQ